MQIIQFLLANNIHPLGVRSSLSHPDKMVLRKESHFLHSRSNFISTIQTKPSLVTSSKFFLSREHEQSIQPLIGWDSWDNQDINSGFPLLEFDSLDSIAPPENSSESIKSSIPAVMPTRIENNTSNDTSQELNLKGKFKSKKINKSQQPLDKKSKPKSKTKKTVKSSTAKNVEQFVDESNIATNRHEDTLLASDEALPVEANSEITTLQQDITSDNTTNDHDSANSPTPSNSPTPEYKSSLFRNIANDNLQETSEIVSSFTSEDSSVTESILSSQKHIQLDKNRREIVKDSPIEFSLLNNVDKIFTPSSNFTNKVIPEASQVVNISDIPVSPTSSKQNIKTSQAHSRVDNQSTASQTNLIQAKEVLPTLNSPSPEEELPNTNSNFQAITAIKSNLILESAANDFVTDNAVVDNSLTLSSTLTSLDVDDAPTLVHPLENDENTIGAHSYKPKAYIAVPNSESSVIKSPIAIQQEIDSNVLSEFPASAAVQLTPTSADIEDTPSLFKNSDNNEQLVTLELQSAMTVNVSDVSANVTSLQHDSNVENTTSESTENQPILALPEIGETAMSNDKPVRVHAPLITTSPEIAEASTISATSPEIGETASIFPKIIDHEQTAESEFTFSVTNPEISTFVDTSDNLTSPQDEVSTPPKVEQNAIAENFPAPKGYAIGGQVINSHIENCQQIAPSDIVPAMLTPGEFVINTQDAQKNLPLLHHINTGGTPQDIILPSLQTPNPKEAEEKTSPETPTKIDSFPDTSLHLKSAETHLPQISNSLIPSSLGLDIGKQKLSIVNSPQLNTLQNETMDVGEPSPQYSSPPLIFRKVNPTTNTPSQWSSVEELLNVNNDEFTSLNFSGVESNRQNSEFSHVLESPQVFAKHLPSPRGFVDGGEVTPPDISREIKSVTETIENTPSSSEGDDTADIEALAREIYQRLRQRIEIERERHGDFSGRLPW